MNLSFNRRRYIGAVALLAAWLGMATLYLGWALFGTHDRFIATVLSFTGLVLGLRVLPTLQEFQKWRDTWDLESKGSIAPHRPWRVVAGIVIGMLIALFMSGSGLRIARGDALHDQDWFNLVAIAIMGAAAGVIAWRQLRTLHIRREHQD